MEEACCLYYGITPPKASNTTERIAELATIQQERLDAIPMDALVVYDLQDESTRTDVERPFPFMQTVAPLDYLSQLQVPESIVYCSVGKFTEASFMEWLYAFPYQQLVLVGAPSTHQSDQHLRIGRAYQLAHALRPDLKLGGITIPERHARKGDEHLRVLSKIEAGCSFFISQCVYSIEHALNFLADTHYHLKKHGVTEVRFVFTLTPCASEKTLRFMEWLGINVPNWVKQDLLHADNMLERSLELCLEVAERIIQYCAEKQIPFGFNVESVSIRKEEIDASIRLFESLHTKKVGSFV
jgi:hypothetical protein